MSEIDRSLVGSFSTPFVVDVEKGAIRKFADAIGDPNPLYRDLAFARAHGHAHVLAPPTFPTCFRPPEDPPWFAPLDRRRVVAGQVAFIYEQPIVAGMVLTCRLEFRGVEDKTGSRGNMELIHQRLHGVDAKGLSIFTMDRTTLYRSREQVDGKSLA